LFAEVHSTNAGYCIDFGHAHYAGGGVDYWLDKLGDRILTTHIHDNRGRDDEHRPPGFGTIPWPDVIARLRALGYDGYANFESGPWEMPDMVDGYRHAIEYWRECERIAAGG
ncbi:MAG: sugar phosphate isomerase/epimerase, partial [Kiritimatiellae bacterium]|nr:sugar phosphate isomerase/epimerase [Kiritimatiellia bacterium]